MTDLKARFERRVDRTADCHVWTGSRDRRGYGRIHVGGLPELAHRVAWRLTNGAIPDGLFILHRCDNPSCVRVEHLFLGTHQDNMDDMRRKGRAAKHDRSLTAPRGDDHWTRRNPDRRPRGEGLRRTKLTAEQVHEIRALLSVGVPQHEIARRFGVFQTNISAIKCGRSWAHLETRERRCA